MRALRFFLVLLFLIAGWLVGWSNNTPVELSLLIWSFPSLPVFVYYFIFLFVGLSIGLFLGRFSSKK